MIFSIFVLIKLSTMLKQITLFTFFSMLLLACGAEKKTMTNTTTESSTKQDKGKETKGIIMQVNSYKNFKPGEDRVTPYLLTQEGEKNTGNWDYYYTNIQGFEFEPGYFYKIMAKRALSDDGMPKMELVSVLSKERDPKYFSLHNIWALSHLNGEELKVTARRPTLEILLNAMKVGGMASCNGISGNIEVYTERELSFGPITRSKKMCEEMQLENEYLKALAATRIYTVEEGKGYLVLFDENQKELLRFKNVD